MDEDLTPIPSLTAGSQNFKIYGRVTYIQENKNGNGIHFLLTDSLGCSIKCIVTVEAVVKHCNDQLKLGQPCYVRGGRVDYHDKTYPSRTGHDCVIYINNIADIQITTVATNFVTPIATLNAPKNIIKVHGKITQLGKYSRNEVFCFVITDDKGDSVNVAAFCDFADWFHDSLKEKQWYYIYCGLIEKVCKPNDQKGPNNVIILDNQFQMVTAESEHWKPTNYFNRVKLRDVNKDDHLQLPIDVLVAVVDFKKRQPYKLREENQHFLRNMTVVDDSGTEMCVTLWGQQAIDTMAKDFQNRVIAFKGVVVAEFGNQLYLSVSPFTKILNPPNVEGVAEMQNWFNNYRPRRSAVLSNCQAENKTLKLKIGENQDLEKHQTSSSLSDSAGPSTQMRDDEENSRQQLWKYQKIKDSFRDGLQLQKAEAMVKKLTSINSDPEVDRLAHRELENFKKLTSNYLQAVEMNILKIKKNGTSSDFQRLPEEPKFSNEFMRLYRNASHSTPSNSCGTEVGVNSSSQMSSTSSRETTQIHSLSAVRGQPTGSSQVPTSPRGLFIQPNIATTSDPLAELEDLNCTICFDEMTNFKETIKCECRRRFHLRCVYEWLNKEGKCPTCRKLLRNPADYPPLN